MLRILFAISVLACAVGGAAAQSTQPAELPREPAL